MHLLAAARRRADLARHVADSHGCAALVRIGELGVMRRKQAPAMQRPERAQRSMRARSMCCKKFLHASEHLQPIFAVKCSSTAAAIAPPSVVAVPRPSSSSATRLHAVAWLSAAAVSSSSTRNVDWRTGHPHVGMCCRHKVWVRSDVGGQK